MVENRNEKNEMQSISGIIYLILIACLLPYVFTIIAKKAAGFKARDNQNPREFLGKTTGLAARAHAVQQNSFESLPLFIAAILMAEYMVVQQTVIMKSRSGRTNQNVVSSRTNGCGRFTR